MPRPTMRAARIVAPRRVEVEEVPRVDPGPGQVRVRLEGCGVCGSNLPVWQGRPWFTYPTEPGAPGHEGWGRVEAVGAGVAGLREGDRVALLSYHAYAEADVAEAGAVLRLPEGLDGQILPGEPLACAWNVFRRGEIRAGQAVAIVGIGFLGALLTQLAARAGARVIAVARRPFAREVARRCGAAEVVPLDDHRRVIEVVHALTGGDGCERVIEAVGEQGALDLAGELTRVRGRLLVAGYHQDGPRTVNMQLWNWRGLDVINAHERDPKVYVEGMAGALEAVASGALDPSPLFTHRFGLDGLASAFEVMEQRPEGFLKAWIAP